MNNNKSRRLNSLYMIARIEVPDNKVNWYTPFDNYIEKRPYYIHPDIIENLKLNEDNPNRWTEPHNIYNPQYYYKNLNVINDSITKLKERITYVNGYKQTLLGAGIIFNADNMPINPVGRTGLYGPGILGKNGPNQINNVIITRFTQFDIVRLCNTLRNFRCFKKFFKELILELSCLEGLVIVRKNTNKWEIPMKEDFSKIEDLNLFNGNIIYRGYLDDSRNTDSRWLESTVIHYHSDDAKSKEFSFDSVYDNNTNVEEIVWVKISILDPIYKDIYSNKSPISYQLLKNIFPYEKHIFVIFVPLFVILSYLLI